MFKQFIHMFRLWRKLCCNQQRLNEIRGGIGYRLARQFPISSSNFGSKLKGKFGFGKRQAVLPPSFYLHLSPPMVSSTLQEEQERTRRNKLEEILGL